MKEDMLEQLCEEYFQLKGYFTIDNVKFKPSKDDPDYIVKQDCVPSDVDVVGFNPVETGAERVVVCSCKSWQEGFFPSWEIKQIENQRTVRGREAWRTYRELCSPKWAKALKDEIQMRTGKVRFTYYTVVTALGKGERREIWENCEKFAKVLSNSIKILTLREIIKYVAPKLSFTVANSNIGRIVQLLKASGEMSASA